MFLETNILQTLYNELDIKNPMKNAIFNPVMDSLSLSRPRYIEFFLNACRLLRTADEVVLIDSVMKCG